LQAEGLGFDPPILHVLRRTATGFANRLPTEPRNALNCGVASADDAPVDPATAIALPITAPQPTPTIVEAVGAAKGTSTADALADVDLPDTSSNGLVADSAIILGATTALLYVLSHVFGEVYLDTFGVEAGFHGFGLNNLAMIPFLAFVFAGVIAFLIADAFRSKSWIYALVITGCTIVASAVPLISHMSAGQAAVPTDVGWILATLVVGGVMLRRRSTWTTKLENLDAALAKARSSLNSAHDKQIDTPQIRQLERIRGYLKVRVWQLRATVYIVAAYLVVVSVLPAYANRLALSMADHTSAFVALDANSSPRIPIYWVGDRVVFLTVRPNAGECLVTVQIDGGVQTVRDCPPLISRLLSGG
jgi:hypothetical protein